MYYAELSVYFSFTIDYRGNTNITRLISVSGMLVVNLVDELRDPIYGFNINLTSILAKVSALEKFFCDLAVSSNLFSYSHSIVLVDLNEFPWTFQKKNAAFSLQTSENTLNLLRINLKDKLRFNHSWPLEGAMYITVW